MKSLIEHHHQIIETKHMGPISDYFEDNFFKFVGLFHQIEHLFEDLFTNKSLADYMLDVAIVF